jgi:hypothetical protein
VRRIAPAGPVEPPPVERIDPRALLGPEPVLVPGSPAGVVVALWVIVVLKQVGAVARSSSSASVTSRRGPGLGELGRRDGRRQSGSPSTAACSASPPSPTISRHSGTSLGAVGEDGDQAPAAGLMAVGRDVGEAGGEASLPEQVGLFVGPAVAGEAGRSRFDLTLDSEEAARGTQHPTDFGEAGVNVVPMVHGR